MKFYSAIAALLLLIASEIARVYYIMPFPGSQRIDSIDLAYWLDTNIRYIRGVLGIIAVLAIYPAFRSSGTWKKIVLGIFLCIYGVVFYLFNFRFLAETMF